MSAFSIAADGMLALIGNGAPRRLSSSSVPDSKELQVSGDGKFLYLIGPIATQIAIFSLEAEDWVPQELPEDHSPFGLKTGEWILALN